MTRSKFSEERIVYVFDRQTPTPPLRISGCRARGECRHLLGLEEKKCAHLGVSEPPRFRQLEEKNSWSKQLVTDLSLDKYMLAEALQKTVYGPPAAGNSLSGSGDASGAVCGGLAGWHN